MAPTLAVDLRVLEFVRLLFIRQSPNQTAWCDTLETFLDGMKYKLASKVSISLLTVAPMHLTFFQNSLRHRFSNAFHWYRVLTVFAQDHISTLITDAQKDSSHLDQPSEYLRSRCPLCFGGNDWQNKMRDSPSDMCIIYFIMTMLHQLTISRLGIIVCIDALWDVHHPWAGKPLFSGHMRTIPMCSLCIPAFPEFRNMRPSAGDPDIDRGNSGNRRTTFGHHSYPSRTSHVISGSLLVRICLVLSSVYLIRHYSTCYSLRNRIT